jgi:hypothetical protein
MKGGNITEHRQPIIHTPEFSRGSRNKFPTKYFDQGSHHQHFHFNWMSSPTTIFDSLDFFLMHLDLAPILQASLEIPKDLPSFTPFEDTNQDLQSEFFFSYRMCHTCFPPYKPFLGVIIDFDFKSSKDFSSDKSPKLS